MRFFISNDIDLENKDWTPIGKEKPAASAKSSYNNKPEDAFGFGGVFDGQNHTIKNLKVVKNGDFPANNMFCALFGIILPGTTIKNLTIENAELSGYLYIGAFVGEIVNADATPGQPVSLENLKLTGEASIVSLNGEGCIGGILGRSESLSSALTIKDCIVAVAGSSEINVTSRGVFSTFGGGIVGAAYGAAGTTMSGCSSNISVSGEIQGIGGLAGLFWNGTIVDCHVNAPKIELKHYENDVWYDSHAVGGFIGCTGKTGISIDGSSTCTTTIHAYVADTASAPLFNKGLVGAVREPSGDGTPYQKADSSDYVTIDQNFDYSGIVIENTFEPSVD